MRDRSAREMEDEGMRMRQPSALSLLALADVISGSTDCAPPRTALPEGALPLEFRPADLGERFGPRFLPAAVTVPLSPVTRGDYPGSEILTGFLYLGPKLDASEAGLPIFIERAGGGSSRERLFVEEPGDGQAPPARRIEPTAGHLGVQPIFRLDPAVAHLEAGRARTEDYVVEIVIPPTGGDQPPSSVTAYGFSERMGRVRAGDSDLSILLADGNSDGLFGPGDPWVVLEGAELLAAPFTSEEAREVGDFAWAAGRAWMLHLEGTAGRRAHLVPHDPGVAEEEDKAARGAYAADRAMPASAVSLPCPRIAAGAAPTPDGGREALPAGVDGPATAGPRLILLDAPSCAQCDVMARYVLPSIKVAQAGAGMTCELIDASVHRRLLEEYHLSGVPSGILLDPDGIEIARFEGYLGVNGMAALLRRAR
jgi:hypothetical protein